MNPIQPTLSQHRPRRSSSNPLLHKLEDAIHRIIMRQSAPNWLPFLPVGREARQPANPLAEEESMSTTTVRGWPFSDYFIQVLSKLRIPNEHVQNRRSFLNIRENSEYLYEIFSIMIYVFLQ
ncbi:hypothetical protein UlMin_006752 [Ulmus minor]